jgi:imidazolonepropionase-like amidohydrolase
MKPIYVIGGTLIDGKGGKPLDNSFVEIVGNKIKTVGERRDIKVPQDGEIIDATGKCVLQG